MPMSRYANRHHRQTEPPIIVATAIDTRVVIQGENLDVNELDAVRRELLECKQKHSKVIKEHNKMMKQADEALEMCLKKTKSLNSDTKKLGGYLLEYESIIQHLEKAGQITFRNRPVGKQNCSTRTVANMEFVYIHDKDGNEISFQDLPDELQKLENNNTKLKVLCEKLIKQSLPTGGTLQINMKPGDVDVSLNHDESGVISAIDVDYDNNYKEWSWRGIDYKIDIDNKRVLDMEGRQVGETIGKIPTLWDKWWEELD